MLCEENRVQIAEINPFCEENRVQIAEINPRGTSKVCNRRGIRGESGGMKDSYVLHVVIRLTPTIMPHATYETSGLPREYMVPCQKTT